MRHEVSNQAAKLSPLQIEDDEGEEVPLPAFELRPQVSAGSSPCPTPHLHLAPATCPSADYSRTAIKASEHLQTVHKRTLEKINSLRERRKREELAECTFTPNVRSTSPPRSFEEFYTCQKMHESSRKDRIERERKASDSEKRLAEIHELKQVQMSQGSREILKEKPTLSLVQRLNVPKRSQTPSKPPAGPKASKEAVQAIVSRLNKSPERPAPESLAQFQSLKSVISVKSEELVNSLLEKEIGFHWEELELGEKANYLQLEFLFRDMNYLATARDKELLYQAWGDMKGEEKGYVSKETVSSFLAAISGSVVSKESIEETDTSESSTLSFTTSPLLRAKYQRFIDNHKANRKKKPPKGPEYSFRPQLSPSNSHWLQKRSSQSGSQSPAKSRERSPEAVLRDMMQDCTFHPKTTKLQTLSSKARYLDSAVLQGIDTEKTPRTDLLFLHGKVIQERKAREKPIDYEFERSKTELTFSPKISPRAATPKCRKSPPSGYEKVVERMRKAATETERLRNLQSRGVPVTRPRHFPMKPPYSPKGLLSPVLQRETPFGNDLSEILISDEPELIANLHLPNGEIVEFTLAAGESLEEKLQELAERKGLTAEQCDEYLQCLRAE